MARVTRAVGVKKDSLALLPTWRRPNAGLGDGRNLLSGSEVAAEGAIPPPTTPWARPVIRRLLAWFHNKLTR